MNTGGLSIINDMAVSDGIVVYSNYIKGAFNQSELLETRYQKIIEQQGNIINLQDMMKYKQGSSILENKEYPDLLTNDKREINAYYFGIVTFRGAIIGYLQRLNGLVEQNTLLTQLIRKDYNLENSL